MGIIIYLLSGLFMSNLSLVLYIDSIKPYKTEITASAPAKTIDNSASTNQQVAINQQVEEIKQLPDTKINDLSQNAPTINKIALKFALKAYEKANKEGLVKNPTLTVIDYSLPSNQRRMWVFNMQNNALLYITYVAHGKNSGHGAETKRFSNSKDSKESSLGTYITEKTYIGHRGYSLNLEGLDKGFNNNAYNRRIVVHGAWYMDPNFIAKEGRAGSSWGCPAIPNAMVKPVINTIKDGSVIFAYYPNNELLSKYDYLSV